MVGLVLSSIPIILGLVFCFRWKELGLQAARRHIAYDAIWFYQLMFLVVGICAIGFGVAALLGWVR